MKRLNLSASLGVAVREFPTSTGEVDYALFVDGVNLALTEAVGVQRREVLHIVPNGIGLP